MQNDYDVDRLRSLQRLAAKFGALKKAGLTALLLGSGYDQNISVYWSSQHVQ